MDKVKDSAGAGEMVRLPRRMGLCPAAQLGR